MALCREVHSDGSGSESFFAVHPAKHCRRQHEIAMTSPRRTPRILGLVVLFAFSLSGACRQSQEAIDHARVAESPESPPISEREPARSTMPEGIESDGHQRMIELLQRVADQAETDNRYVKTAGVKELAGQIEAIKLRLERESNLDELGKKFRLDWEIAPMYLNLGENEKAVEYFQAVFENAPKFADHLTDEQLNSILLEMAVAQLRVGEAQNCIHCQSGESCILPIRNEGVHNRQEGSREAIIYLDMLLQREPQHLTAAWLLNVARMTLGEHDKLKDSPYYISPEKFLRGAEFPEFKEIARDVGLAHFSCSGGASADDFDNDGDLDLIVTDWDVRGEMNVYLNNADGTFTDFSEQAGLKGIVGGLNLIHADYDNDGDIDLFVLRGAWLEEKGRYPNSLLQNDGSAHFRDVTFEAGLGEEHFPTQTAGFADYDNDGDLDLFIGNEDYPCNLFQNDGNGHFHDVAAQAGVTDGGYAKGVTWGDYDEDRWPDLYVSNMNGDNRMFHNLGNGTFEEVSVQLNVSKPEKSFPVWFWDYNNDGHLDLYVSAYKVGVKFIAAEYYGATLSDDHFPFVYRGDGKGGFLNQSMELGLHRVAQPMGANFGDVDNDGFPDFYLGTGYVDFHGLMPNLLYHNVAGEKFDDVTIPARVGHLQKGHAVAFADFDQDGDQDIFVETGGAYRGDAFRNTLFQNPGFNHNFIKLRLEGVQSNRSAIGARIRVDVIDEGSPRSIHRVVGTGGSFGSNPLEQHIGIGTATAVQRIEVYWPTSDTRQSFENLKLQSTYHIREGEAEPRDIPPTRSVSAQSID